MSRKKAKVAEAKAPETAAEAEAEAEAKREDAAADRKAAAQERVAETRNAIVEAERARSAAKPAAAPRRGHVVAPGKSIHCSSRGIVGPGESIEARDICRDFDAAKENFAEHIKAGTIVKA